MNDLEEKKITSNYQFVVDCNKNPIGQYISFVKEIYELEQQRKNKKHLFFRGHADSSWELTPKVLRDNSYNEKQLVLDFYHYGPLHSLVILNL